MKTLQYRKCLILGQYFVVFRNDEVAKDCELGQHTASKVGIYWLYITILYYGKGQGRFKTKVSFTNQCSSN